VRDALSKLAIEDGGLGARQAIFLQFVKQIAKKFIRIGVRDLSLPCRIAARSTAAATAITPPMSRQRRRMTFIPPRFAFLPFPKSAQGNERVTLRGPLGRVGPMRMVTRGVVAVVVLALAYWGWALAGAAQLASAAQRGDAEAVMERVDLQALIRSLASQISRAFLDENPDLQKQAAVRQGVVLNGAAAEMLLRALLTPDNIAAILSQGRVGALDAAGKDAGTVWGMPSLGEAFNARPLQVLMNSHLDGPRSFVVGLDSPDGRYRVHMSLSGMTWLLSGVDLPEPITARLAHLIAQRIGGAVELRGD